MDKDKKIELLMAHKDEAIKILSGGLGEGMCESNVHDKVDVAIMAATLLVRKLRKMYELD